MAAHLPHLHHRGLPILSFLLLLLLLVTFQRAGANTTASTSRKRRMPFIIANSASGSSNVVNRSLLLSARKQRVIQYEQSSQRFRSLSSFCGGSTMAFCSLNSSSSSFNQQRIAMAVPRTTFPSSSMMSSLYATSPSTDNYYKAASSISKSSLSTSTMSSSSSPPSPQEDKEGQQHFPSWWPITESMSKYITFSDHIAHVIIPSADSTSSNNDGDDSSDNNGEICEGMTCGQVIDWVLQAARSRNNNETTTTTTTDTQYSPSSSENDHDDRLQVITNEWNIGQSVSTATTILDPAYRHDPNLFPQSTHYANNLTSAELLAMGSIWSLPYKSSSSSYTSKPTNVERDRFDPSNGIKPTRLSMGNYHDIVSSGDYFRVHFNPRRFVDTNLYDWGSPAAAAAADNDNGSTKPGVIVKRDDETGYMIINKPPNIPVHARVDNLLENVASSVGRMLWLERRESLLHDLLMSKTGSDDAKDDNIAGKSFAQNIKYKRKKNNRQKQKMDQLVYVATPQRLDQNTSGLLVVATKKSFASYFAKLLRTKTSGQLESGGMSRSSSCGVHKSYRCLVCVSPKDNTAMASEVARLQTYQAEGTIIKHFLEPSIRAPKHFVESVPHDADNPESYAECLLKITNITNICTVVGNAPSDALALDLWGKYGKPVETVAILELEIELLTGRTHQIRGQMAALGFPLVGDVQYGGAIPNTASEYMKSCRGRAEGFLDSETLALQCSTLEFLDPDVATATQDFEKVTRQRRSDRWLSFHLDGAFWTSFIKSYHGVVMTYEGSLWKDETSEPAFDPSSSTSDQVLPPFVQLSPGRQKYVLIRATSNPVDSVDGRVEDLWFVRSASPEECDGEYHADVARELLNQLKSLGYTATVMGGGRIDFLDNDEVSHAHVFGLSYGFGKGDHEKVSKIIEEHTSIIATFDVSDGLY